MLSSQHIHKSYEKKSVLEDINFAVNPGEVTALIGENGAGKTTLLKIILGEIQPDSGTVRLHNEVVGYVPQEPLGEDLVRDCFDKTVEQWRIDYALEIAGLASLPSNIEIESLSGGQKTRLALARVLASNQEPTILLFDEPTNNLDVDGLKWLESFIKSFKGGIIIVSHDRIFINKVATKVIELDKGKLKQYGGDYDFYKAQKEIERQTKIAQYERFIDEKKRLLKLYSQKANQMRSTSSQRYDRRMGVPKISFNSSRNAAERNTGQQLRALNSRTERLEEVDRPESIKRYKVDLDGQTTQNKLILRLKNIRKTYYSTLFSNFDLEIRGKDRVHIKGTNGCGKTTLLEIAAGLLEPDLGEVQRGVNVRIGYFSQDVEGLDYDRTGLENLRATEAGNTTIYREARRLGLSEQDLKKKPTSLSRGQQAKLGFAKLLLGANHLLILDEPTNHLDIPTRENIEAALRGYEGAILTASHDEYFLQQIGIHHTINLNEAIK